MKPQIPALLIPVLISGPLNSQVPKPDPTAILESFCKAEFEGNDVSVAEMTALSKERQKALRNAFKEKYPGEHPLTLGDMLGEVFHSDPVMLVRSYRIISKTRNQDTLTAEVEICSVR